MTILKTFALALVVAATLAKPAFANDDPFERFNRSIHIFNRFVVDYVIDPVTGIMQTTVPDIMRIASANIYNNLTEPEFVVTNLMVGNSEGASVSIQRLIVNSTVGLGGLFNLAEDWFGLVRHQTEFSEALCSVGVEPGAYLVLPLIGPTTVNGASLATGFIVGGWYLLNLVSPLLATADLIIDFSASAASLHYVDDVGDISKADPYASQRGNFWHYLHDGCHQRQ